MSPVNSIRGKLNLQLEKSARLEIGKFLMVTGPLNIKGTENSIIRIGDNCFFNHNCSITASESITIGNECNIANNVVIVDHDHKIENDGISGQIEGKPVVLGNRAWIGANVVITKGVSIGDGSVAAAGAVVTKDIPPHEIWGGCSSKFDQENIGGVNMDQPLISIIVPVYNVEKYVEKCINSILDQSYKNIEIILVDDGSEDSSGAICDEYKEKHYNIKVVHKENAGLGFARNSGLEVVEGKFVTFVDSDDWVSRDLIKHMYESMVENHVDFCKSGFQHVKHSGEVVSLTQYENKIYEGDKAAKELLPRMVGSSPDAHDSLEMCVCAVLYNTEIIKEHKLQFPSERVLISEDLVFNIDYLQYANGACSIDTVDYNYRMNDVSLSQRYRPDRLEASAFFYNVMRKKLEGLGYGSDTILRLDRMFFIYTRMSIAQERKQVSEHDKKTSIDNIKRICGNETVQKTISEYPIERLGTKQSIFLKLIQHKMCRTLYAFANRGLM